MTILVAYGVGFPALLGHIGVENGLLVKYPDIGQVLGFGSNSAPLFQFGQGGGLILPAKSGKLVSIMFLLLFCSKFLLLLVSFFRAI